MSVLPARLHGQLPSRGLERLVIVTDPAGEVRVRWRLGKRDRWQCDLCGLQAATVCPHTFSAGLLLAEELLGLTRQDELHPEGTPA